MSAIPYRVIRSDRKTLAIEITRTAEVVVRAPRRTDNLTIERFVSAKSAWIQKHLERRARCQTAMPPFGEAELDELVARAKAELPPRVAHWAHLLGVTYGKITVRRQRTRWGSCSAKGNLNFNALLMLVPPAVREYVILHELCHRKHLNHSARFWAEVARIMPDYKAKEQWLKTDGTALIARLSGV